MGSVLDDGVDVLTVPPNPTTVQQSAEKLIFKISYDAPARCPSLFGEIIEDMQAAGNAPFTYPAEGMKAAQ